VGVGGVVGVVAVVAAAVAVVVAGLGVTSFVCKCVESLLGGELHGHEDNVKIVAHCSLSLVFWRCHSCKNMGNQCTIKSVGRTTCISH